MICDAQASSLVLTSLSASGVLLVHSTPLLRKAVAREIRILQGLPNHKCIAQLLEVIETPRSIHIVLEYVSGGTLQQRVATMGRIEERCARPLVRQMLEAVEHCHAHGLCHRDLKLENVVQDKSGQHVKLIDFGLSACWRPGDPLLTKTVGSLPCMAPEVLARRGYRGTPVDAWGMGVAIVCMLCGALPFEAESDALLRDLIMRAEYSLTIQEAPRSARYPANNPRTHIDEMRPSTAACDLVGRLIVVDDLKRLTISESLSHEWVIGIQIEV